MAGHEAREAEGRGVGLSGSGSPPATPPTPSLPHLDRARLVPLAPGPALAALACEDARTVPLGAPNTLSRLAWAKSAGE